MTCLCQKEKVQQKIYSPVAPHSEYIVGDHEIILYVLYEPKTYNKISGALFSKSDLKKGTLSVCRKNFSTKEEVFRQVINPLMCREGTFFIGCIMTPCQLIRGIENSLSERLFCVIDDGEEFYSAHAHLGFSEVIWGAQNDRTAARGELRNAFKAYTPTPLTLDECFELS